MGRVRRYKKLKSCDPFAKKKRVADDGSEKYDEPPSDVEDDFLGDGLNDDLIFLRKEGEERQLHRDQQEALTSNRRTSLMPAAAAALWDSHQTTGTESRIGSETNGADGAPQSKAALRRARKRAREEKNSTLQKREELSVRDAIASAQSELQRVLKETKEVKKISTEVTMEEVARRKRKESAQLDMSKRRPGESLRDFKRRVRQEARTMATMEAKETSSTSIKKKEHLVAKKLEAKMKRKDGGLSAYGRALKAAQVPDDEKFADERSLSIIPGALGAQPSRRPSKGGTESANVVPAGMNLPKGTIVGLQRSVDAPPTFDASMKPRGALDRREKKQAVIAGQVDFDSRHSKNTAPVGSHWSRGMKMASLLNEAEALRQRKERKMWEGGSGTRINGYNYAKAGRKRHAVTPARQMRIEKAKIAATEGYKELKRKRRQELGKTDPPAEGSTL